MKLEASITGKRQITIPKDLYNEMGLRNTDKLEFNKNEKGEIVVSKKEISELNLCKVCNREVLNTDTMVVEDYQKYHISCWNLKNKENLLDSDKYISNKLTKSQVRRIEEINEVKKEVTLDLVKKLKDSEVIINVPIKLTFSSDNSNMVGSISNFDSKYILECNK